MHACRPSKRVARVAPLLSAALLFASAEVSAQTKDELDKARIEFQEGVALSAANNCAGALVKFRSVLKVKTTPQVAFNIAECEERIGKLAAALGNYRLAASAAGDDKKARDVSSKVGDRIASLEERVPKLTITRGKGAETAAIELDGVELGTSQFGSPIPVDPGPHVVVAKVGNKVYARETLNLAEKETKTFDVVLKNVALDKVYVPPTETGEKPAEAPPKGRSIVPGVVVTAAGAVAAGVGVAFLVMRGSTISDLDKLCGGGTNCPPSAEPTADKGRLYTGMAEVLIPIGTVAVVAGIVLIVTAGPKAPPKPAAALLATPSGRRIELVGSAPGSEAGVSVLGRF